LSHGSYFRCILYHGPSPRRYNLISLSLKVVSQASLFDLTDGLEARQTRNAHLARVHINAHVSANAEEVELFDGEEPVDPVESDFIFRWHDEHPSEANAFVGRMLS
jgi:hypothetical protein